MEDEKNNAAGLVQVLRMTFETCQPLRRAAQEMMDKKQGVQAARLIENSHSAPITCLTLTGQLLEMEAAWDVLK